MHPVRKGYIDGVHGQVHLLDTERAGSTKPPLLCLHATAYSAESLRPLVSAFGPDRHVMALDTPGYGGSDGPDAPIAIEDYADALADSIARLSPEGPVDIFAYHTGATIAFDAAARYPHAIGRIVAIGVPLFSADEREEWHRRLVVRHALDEGLDQFDERWSYLVAGRPQGLSLADGFANFVDELRAWPRGWWAHQALFAHDLAARLPQVTAPVLIINPPSALAPMSRAAAALLPQACLIERPDLTGALFVRHAQDVAAMTARFLDEAPERAVEGSRG